jgi:hypothetical protein
MGTPDLNDLAVARLQIFTMCLPRTRVLDGNGIRIAKPRTVFAYTGHTLHTLLHLAYRYDLARNPAKSCKSSGPVIKTVILKKS